jgi:GLPGLI family protein
MNTFFKTLFLVIIAQTVGVAQDFQGTATYMSKSTVDMNFGGRQMPEAQKKMIQERMKSMLEKTFVLNFNRTSSTYEEEQKLDAPGAGGPGMRFMGFGGGSGVYYKDIQAQTYTNETDIFGKPFLVEDTLKPLAWTLTAETKQIGQYTCFKATTIRLASEVNWMSANWGRSGQRNAEQKEDSTSTKENNNTDAEIIEKPEEVVVVTAWYTPQIPVSQGPSDYWGLPGLILEVNAGTTTMLCSKIVLNPTEKTEIVKPHKGQVVSKKEYHEIINKKMQEFRDSRRRGDGRNSGRPRN